MVGEAGIIKGIAVMLAAAKDIVFSTNPEVDAVKALEEAFKSVTTIEPKDLLYYSLPIFGYSHKRQAGVKKEENTLRFKEFFGVEPTTVAPVLNDLKEEYPEYFRVEYGLMTFHWFKCYGTERTIAGPWKVGCLQSLRDTIKLYTDNISSLRVKKIVWGGFEEDDEYPVGTDGMHALICK
eukprot:scaffold7957_cov68-Cyclotella_meneghiniana.AAC.2